MRERDKEIGERRGQIECEKEGKVRQEEVGSQTVGERERKNRLRKD